MTGSDTTVQLPAKEGQWGMHVLALMSPRAVTHSGVTSLDPRMQLQVLQWETKFPNTFTQTLVFASPLGKNSGSIRLWNCLVFNSIPQSTHQRGLLATFSSLSLFTLVFFIPYHVPNKHKLVNPQHFQSCSLLGLPLPNSILTPPCPLLSYGPNYAVFCPIRWG